MLPVACGTKLKEVKIVIEFRNVSKVYDSTDTHALNHVNIKIEDGEFVFVVGSSGFALPIGYILMKRWLETYANHIHLTIWSFIAVFFITCVIVLLSIFRQVKEAALANPAESVKSE